MRITCRRIWFTAIALKFHVMHGGIMLLEGFIAGDVETHQLRVDVAAQIGMLMQQFFIFPPQNLIE